MPAFRLPENIVPPTDINVVLKKYMTPLPLGHHTLGMECKGVLSTGEGVGLTQSTINSFARI